MPAKHTPTAHSSNTAAAVVLPPQHPDTFRGAKASASNSHAGHHHHHHHGGGDPYARAARAPPHAVQQQVFSPDGTEVLTLPAVAVEHMPRSGLHITKLVLCAHRHAPTAAAGAMCPKGVHCKYVHAALSAAALAAAPRTTVHANTAWRSLEAVTYERFPAGRPLQVWSPDGAAVSDEMDSGFTLRTLAPVEAAATLGGDGATAIPAAAGAAALRHCAHFYYSRACNLGPQCHFVHAVFIDRFARRNQRAPAPRELGRAQNRFAVVASSMVSSPRSGGGVVVTTDEQKQPSSFHPTGNRSSHHHHHHGRFPRAARPSGSDEEDSAALLHNENVDDDDDHLVDDGNDFDHHHRHYYYPTSPRHDGSGDHPPSGSLSPLFLHGDEDMAGFGDDSAAAVAGAAAATSSAIADCILGAGGDCASGRFRREPYSLVAPVHCLPAAASA